MIRPTSSVTQMDEWRLVGDSRYWRGDRNARAPLRGLIFSTGWGLDLASIRI